MNDRLGLFAPGVSLAPGSFLALHILRHHFLPDLHVRIEQVLESDRHVVVQMWVSPTRDVVSAGWAAVSIIGFDEHNKIDSTFAVQDTAEFLVAAGVLSDREMEARLEVARGHAGDDLDWERPLS